MMSGAISCVVPAFNEERDRISPNLGGDTMRAILEGLPYPQTLLQAAIRGMRVRYGDETGLAAGFYLSADSARARSLRASSPVAFTATLMAGAIDATLMPSRSAAWASASRSSSPVMPKSLPASAT